MKAVQCRMARAALRIGVRELAEAACVSTSTISKLERGESLMSRTAQAVKGALEARGIEFFDNPPGAGLRDAPPARDKRAA
jgi:transcriptional regulator with XRE-family HTH domain